MLALTQTMLSKSWYVPFRGDWHHHSFQTAAVVTQLVPIVRHLAYLSHPSGTDSHQTITRNI